VRVLVIGDTHAPCMDVRYIKFLSDLHDQWNINRIVHIGDLVDNAAISYHPKSPSLRDSEREFSLAMDQVQMLYRLFPTKVDWLVGNHDALTERNMADCGLPRSALMDYTELWEIPKWVAHPRFTDLEIDGVIYRHGDKGKGGAMPAYSNAQSEFCSVVQGHYHAVGGVMYGANNKARYFGGQTGCGINISAAAFDYGKKFSKRPVLGAMVVIDGNPFFEPMCI